SVKKKSGEEDDGPLAEPKEKFVPRNWTTFKKHEKELNKLGPMAKSRYMAYEEPSKDILAVREKTLKRLKDLKKDYEMNHPPVPEEVIIEKDKHAKLIGQLKAAEARNRLRIMRLRYSANRAQEINHLISCQPTAIKAVRLQALVPSSAERKDKGDRLDKLQRHRIESLLEDSRGLLTNRLA
ncbi:protein LKAAEAR1-like, partial [Lingula anatina]|uniref:Protein LKAAEAR1-like n=1 Tax=Lingula anatina TaxID=7574 RepID=A0A1S3I9I2_LINAN